MPQTMVADYADDKINLSISENPVTTSSNLQLHLNLITNLYDKWHIKINQSKSIHAQEVCMSNLYIEQHPNSRIGHSKIPGTQS